MGGYPLDPYRVTIGLTNGRQVVAVAAFDREQAEVAVELLSRPYEDRQEVATQLNACITHMRKEGPLGNRTIQITKKTQSGIITNHPVSLYWRAALLLVRAIRMNNPEGLRSLKAHLDRIARGIAPNNTIAKPFLHSEGIKPKGSAT